MSLESLVAVLAVSMFGMAVVFPGSIKLRLVERLPLDDARMGRLITVWQATTLAITLAVGPLLGRFGHRFVLSVGFLIIALAFWLFAVARRPPTAFLAAIALGAGGSCLNAGGNTLLVALHPDNPAAASNLGNVFFGLGAFVVPFLIGFLFERMSFGGALTVFAVVALGAAVPAGLSSYPQLSSGFQWSTGLELLRSPAVLLSGLVLFCYIGLEVSAASWTTTYLRKAGFEEKHASLIFAFFWVAMMAGRLGASRFVSIGIGQSVIQTVAVAAALVLLLMTLTGRRVLAGGGVILLGLCFAPIFPTTVGLTLAKFNPSLYGTVFAIIFAIGLLGSSVVPVAIGAVAKKRSIRASYWIMFGLALLLFALAFGL